MSNPTQLSPEGAALIGQFEGFSDVVYNDPWNATWGYGHLLHYGPATRTDHIRWDGKGRGVALAMLQLDARVNGINPIAHDLKVSINQSQFDALVSFGFNCGAGALEQVIATLNRGGQPDGVMSEYVHGNGGVYMAGLARRRAAELWMFHHGTTPLYGAKPPRPAYWFLLPDEKRWVTNWNNLRNHTSPAAHRTRLKLKSEMGRRMVQIEEAAKHTGWHKANRTLRHSLLGQYVYAHQHITKK